MTPSGWDTPWKISNQIWRFLAYPRIRLLFARNRIDWGQGWRFYGTPVIQKHRRSSMSFGPGLQLRSSLRSNPLGPNHPVILCTWQAGARLQVGANFAMTGGALCAAERIVIGDNVAVGANTTIADTDFHPVNCFERQMTPGEGETAAITIGDFVFIGMNCLILKGVTLGRGCVIGAGSVVTRDVPQHAVAAGNPARVLRQLSEPLSPAAATAPVLDEQHNLQL